MLILGIDGMDARTTTRLLGEGKLPNIEKYLKRGASGEGAGMLGALPTITPPCWTTLATGAWPATHGITCYWRQSPDSLDAVVYNMDSVHCMAEQLWNISAQAGKKTLVWHWPGSSWPPTCDSPNLHVVDGTQPGSVNMGVSQCDWEKIIIASEHFDKLTFTSHVEKAAGVGCNITNLNEITGGGEDMMELWWGDKARKTGVEIRTYIKTNEDTETFIGGRVGYDSVHTPLYPAAHFPNAPEGAKTFPLVISGVEEYRIGMVYKNTETGEWRVRVYQDMSEKPPIVEFGKNDISCAVDTVIKNGETRKAYRGYKLLDVFEDGKAFSIWISNALDITNDELWHPKSLLAQTARLAGYVPAVSLIGGEDADLVDKVFLPSWDAYNKWQAGALKALIGENKYEVVFTHLHNVDCAGHQFWHLCKALPPWSHVSEDIYQSYIERVYQQTDEYLGRFIGYLDEGWTIFIVSDHGLLVGEEIPPLIGEYGGLNVPIMRDLGYTTLKKDEHGNELDEVDWSKTIAVQIRSNYIYLNLKGRDAHGIVDPIERYELESRIISDLYSYRDPQTGKRVVGIAMRNRDAIALGAGGPESGDIFFTVDEGFNRLHGDGLTTAQGYAGTSTLPVFIASGKGIRHGFTTKRVIRQADIAPTAADLLGLRPPAQSEGGIVHQIIEQV